MVGKKVKEKKNSLYQKLQAVCYDYMWKIESKKGIKNYIADGQPLFNHVEIETINRCNGTCPFCPVNANQEQRVYHRMTEETFIKIIEELRTLNYDGRLALFSNNEPFLDPRMPDFIELAKRKVPKATVYVYSNGTVLDIKTFERVIRSLDEIVLDNYSDDGSIIPNIADIIEFIEKNPVFKPKVTISMRKVNEVLTSRGGQAPNKGKVKTVGGGCYYPFKQFIIRPTGEVSLCCNDALGKYTMGNINETSMKEIWYSSRYNELRSEMLKNGRKNLQLCRYCDTRYID